MKNSLDMINNIALPTAGLIILKNNKLLLAYSKNKKAWYLPGGKIDEGETSAGALQREIQEELNILMDMEQLKFYCHITAPAYGEQSNIIMEQDCFIYPFDEEISPSNEIGEVKFFDYEMYKAEPCQVIGVLLVFEHLFKDKLLFG